ncbi:hypothetical protein [Nocardia rhamnosiphila]
MSGPQIRPVVLGLAGARTVWWWPAALIGVVTAATARYRIRTATDAYATLLETATRLHAVSLATQLGIEHAGPLRPQLGRLLTRHQSAASSLSSETPICFLPPSRNTRSSAARNA